MRLTIEKPGFFALAFFLVISVSWAYSEEPWEVFAGVPAELNLYSRSSLALGGGLFLGLGGDGVAMGMRALYSRDMDNFQSLELTAFLRLYLPELRGNHRLFAQLNMGPGLFWEEDNDTQGAFCVGLTLGFRYLYGDTWFVEPSVRMGYPFLAGAGVAAGYRM